MTAFVPWAAAVAVLLVARPAASWPGDDHDHRTARRLRRRSTTTVPSWATAVGAAVVAGVIWFPLAPLGAALASGYRRWRRRSDARRAVAAIAAELPEVVDLLVLAIGAGGNVRLALEAVAPRAPPRFGAVFRRALDRTGRGDRLADALVAEAGALGDPARVLIAALVASERYGGALLPSLERIAADARADRRRRAEEAARRLPVTLLFPLVLCVLPAFGVLTVVPLLAGAVGALGR